MFNNIHSKVNIFRHWEIFSIVIDSFAYILNISAAFFNYGLSFTIAYLHESEIQRLSEFFNLISCIVYIEFTLNIVSCPFHNFSKAVAYSASSGITDMHRTCGIGRYKFNQYLFTGSGFSFTVFTAFLYNGVNNFREPSSAEEKVDKPRTCNFCSFKISSVKNKFVAYHFSNFSWRELKSFCAYHSSIYRKISVAFVCRNFYSEIGKRFRRSFSGSHQSAQRS